ncbi:MAG: type II toxin-antitoxin system PemK/MazF family toxin [Chloroflexota bacterium]|nr:type II toxin-antitoxin system PemK/MazF family toxin [Chloroflexota bacterium]
MAGYAPGDLVIAPFPYIEQEIGGKIRPALVLAVFAADVPALPTDQVLILCEITSHVPRDANDLVLETTDLQRGRLPQRSTIRLSRIWTFADQRVHRRVGVLTPAKWVSVATHLHRIFDV